MAQQTAVDKLIQSNQNAADQFRRAFAKSIALQFGKKVADRWGMTEVPESIIEQYFNETFGGQGSPDISPNTQNK